MLARLPKGWIEQQLYHQAVERLQSAEEARKSKAGKKLPEDHRKTAFKLATIIRPVEPWHCQTVAKRKTLEQVEAMQAKAVQFLTDVVGDEERAAEFEAMTPEEYAEHKGVEIVGGNPGATITVTRRSTMTKNELEDRVQELEEENQELQDRLDQVADLVVPEEDEEVDNNVECDTGEDEDDLDETDED